MYTRTYVYPHERTHVNMYGRMVAYMEAWQVANHVHILAAFRMSSGSVVARNPWGRCGHKFESHIISFCTICQPKATIINEAVELYTLHKIKSRHSTEHLWALNTHIPARCPYRQLYISGKSSSTAVHRVQLASMQAKEVRRHGSCIHPQ